jgi:hypothetical protein
MIPTSFSHESLNAALQGLGALCHAEAGIPRSGGFCREACKKGDANEIRQMLEAWIGGDKETSGWILTTEGLHIFPGASGLPQEIPLHAELYRASDKTSLNLRHSPTGWNWEELKDSSKNTDGTAFIEEQTIMIDPNHLPASAEKNARYHIEWKLEESPSSLTPATFRPSRSRFVGWE